jgi:hypothetical protein
MTRFAGVRFVQTHIATNPATSTTIFLAFFVAVWCTTGLLTGKLSGWAALARRFGSTLPFPDQRWRWKSARMRWGANYNNCLTIGADPTGLYLSPFFFYSWPPENHVYRMRRFRLGREEQIPFTIRASLADQIRPAAATSWPVQVISPI